MASQLAHAAVHYAVTHLFLVGGATRDVTSELCHHATPPALAVGVNWRHDSDDMVIQLCQQRQRVEEIDPSQLVFQHIDVYDAPVCPTAMELFFVVHDDLVVCVRRVLASEVLTSGNYISDVWVSTQLHYNTDAVGWRTIPESVQAPADSLLWSFWNSIWQSSYHGAFISYQRPVVPVREVRILPDVNADFLQTACVTWFGAHWEDTGAGYLGRGSHNKGELCMRRAFDSENAPVLLEVAVTRGASGCSSRFSQTETLDRGVHLCFRWGEATATDAPIVGIFLESQLAGKTPQPTLPGGYQLVSSTSLNIGRRAVFIYVSRGLIKDLPNSEPLNGPPLVAKKVTDSDTTKLTFKILQLADLHYTGDPTTECKDAPSEIGSKACSEAIMTKFVNELLDFEKPDFVAFSGDNVETFKSSLRQEAMDAATAGVEARGIPYSMIFGNHDDVHGFRRESLMEMAIKKKHSYTQRGPLEVYGVGNYELDVQAPVDGSWGVAGSDVFRMYFLDSNAYPVHGWLRSEDTKYDWIRPNQVEYYRQMSAAHDDNRVPAIMFFHIPLPEYGMDVADHRTGQHREDVLSSEVHSDLFSTLVELDEVKATFAGHDHVNEYCYYCYKRESVQLCYGGGAGFGVAYGMKEVQRRARVIEWSVNTENKREIRTWKRVFGRLDERLDDQLLYSN